MNKKSILKHLPYSEPFLFVSELETVHEDGVVGYHTFSGNERFYQGHFKDNPVTPGVILTECCAQIGVVCLGIFLLKNEMGQNIQIGLTSSEMEFLIPVFPKAKVKVVSEKVYFRFQKLKCKVKMFNAQNQLVCRGVISGMLKTSPNEK